jgi:hypothetical protein
MRAFVGIAVGLAASTLAATSFGGQLEPSAADTLGVVAREGECVQFGYISYIRGAANDTADPLSAVAKLGALDVGPGIDTAVADAPHLVGNPLTDGTIVLEQVEDGAKVATDAVGSAGDAVTDAVGAANDAAGSVERATKDARDEDTEPHDGVEPAVGQGKRALPSPGETMRSSTSRSIVDRYANALRELLLSGITCRSWHQASVVSQHLFLGRM